MAADKYCYDEELEIIYELDEKEIYNPIILVKSEEKVCLDNLEANTRLAFLKEHMLDFYVSLCENGELQDYIEVYLDDLFKCYRNILSQMKTQEAMDKEMAMELARDACF